MPTVTAKTSVAVIFGGRSPEHEVSILTAHEALAVLREMPKYEIVPIYISKDGRWLTGPALQELKKFVDTAQLEKECSPLVLNPGSHGGLAVAPTGWLGRAKSVQVDVALPLIHGPNGEDGTLQGTLEMLGIPYAGSGILASALCMDKIAMKRMFREAELPQVAYAVVEKPAWESDSEGELQKLAEFASQPTFVKPARGGSSIGVTAVGDAAGLRAAIDLALEFDQEAIVEVAVVGGGEVNCAVLKAEELFEASLLEAVQAKDGFLTYEQKYMQWSKGSSKSAPAKGVDGHQIPAQMPAGMGERIQSLAKAAFSACMCDGVARVDFLVRGDDVFVNEINTLPGSLAFYLWEASGMPFDQLLEHLIKSGLAREARQRSLLYTLNQNLLKDIEERKGAKRA
jgi:D-alanine-D-alanine ligase